MKSEIVFDNKNDCATIKFGGVAWQLLLQDAASGKFGEDTAKQLQTITTFPETFKKVQIPVEIAKALIRDHSEK